MDTPQTLNTFVSDPSSAASGATNRHGAVNQRISPGDVIAHRYDVVSVLGEGGMGIVYRCRDRQTDREVALKQVIVPKGSSVSDYLAWFSKEARAQAVLDHPGIARATDFGQLVGGSPFLAMDLVPGHSLHDLQQVQLTYPIIWSIVDQVLDALAHAHARGVIHGDLKPSNVLVQPRPGRPPRMHILDFGLAWLKEDPHDERLDGNKAMEFLPHAGAGTPGYMAPEQIQHEMHHVCGATDLYAVGCLIFRLISGKAPFVGTTKELLQMHAYEAPPALTFATEAPAGVADLTARLLAKRPWDRFEFAAEARRAWKTLSPPRPVIESSWTFPRMEVPPPADQPTPAPLDQGPRHLPPAGAGPTGLLSIRPPPLVGREALRTELLKVAHEVAAGQGPSHRLVLLLGPAGVGKTRLAEWLTAAVHEEGQLVPLTIRYRRMRGVSSGMVGAVNQYFNFERADRMTIEASLMARWKAGDSDTDLRAWIAGAAEWLRPTPPHAEHRLGPTGVRFRVESPGVRRQVTRFTIRKIASGRPLLFFLDDLHHAPDTVVEGLLHLHKADRDQRIYMVATVRTEDVQLGSPIADSLRLLRKELGGEVLQVLPMNTDEMGELLRASLPLDDRAMAEATRRSRGFPLFALQQLHAWAHAGDLKLEGGRYSVSEDVLAMRPTTTAELWDSRLKALTPAELLAAYAVSTLGIDMRVIVIFALLEDLGLSPTACVGALRRAEIILPRGSERYTWPHALLQEHLLRKLHARPDAQRVFESAARALTHHPMVGTRRVKRQRVLNLLSAGRADAAAGVLFDFLAHSSNGSLQPRASLSDLELLDDRLSGILAARQSRWRAEMLRLAGRPGDARRTVAEAREDLRPLLSAGAPGASEEEAHCLRLMGLLEAQRGQQRDGLRLVGQALEIFSTEGAVLGMAQCEAALSDIQYQLGEYTLARRSARSGADHFAAIDRPLGRGRCLLRLCWIAHREGRTRRARRLTFEARQELESSGYRPGLAETTLLIAHIEHRLSNFFNAMQKAKEAYALFDSVAILRGKAHAERLMAMIAIDTDDLSQAEGHARQAIEWYESVEERSREADCQLLIAQVQLARHDPEAAEAPLRRARKLLGQEKALEQHLLLTEAWYYRAVGAGQSAQKAVTAASKCFEELSNAGEHGSQMLARLSRLQWSEPEALELIAQWRSAIDDHDRRDRE